MKAALATDDDLSEISASVQAAEEALARHAARSFATAHLTITGQSGNYSDAAGVIVSNATLTIITGGQTLYVPCQVVVGDVPTS